MAGQRKDVVLFRDKGGNQHVFDWDKSPACNFQNVCYSLALAKGGGNWRKFLRAAEEWAVANILPDGA